MTSDSDDVIVEDEISISSFTHSHSPPNEEQQQQQPPNPVNKKQNFITIDGTTYDVTNFNHPGGNIIRYIGQDEDATDIFREFHYRTPKARQVLQTLPQVSLDTTTMIQEPQTEENQEKLKDFRDMRTNLINNGCFEPDYIHVYFRLLELAFYFGMGTWLASYNIYASMLSFIIFKTRCGWVEHEGGHISLTGNKQIDRAIQTITLGISGGLSGTVWNSMHHKHHATPQKIKHDIDLDTTPLIAFFTSAFEKNTNGRVASRYMSRWWMRFQAWLFMPVINGLFVHLFWAYYLHPKKVLGKVGVNCSNTKDINWFEVFIIGLSHTVLPAIFYYNGGYSIIASYLLLMVCNFWNMLYLFGHFSLSHTFTDVINEDQHLLWFEYAIRHTVNISTKSALVSWIMGYLNFQIEHHLFPSMPQYKNAIAAPYVRRFCEKWHKPASVDSTSAYDLEYKEVSYFQAWKMMFTNLNQVGKHYYNNGIGQIASTPSHIKKTN
jgi:fatty acid desaturase